MVLEGVGVAAQLIEPPDEEYEEEEGDCDVGEFYYL